MTNRPFFEAAGAASLAGLLTFGCTSAPAPLAPEATGLHEADHVAAAAMAGESDLAALRQATAAFHHFAAAQAAGYTTALTGCLSDPVLGAQGIHYGNTALIDGTVDPLRPELLLYEPQSAGPVRLVAVEFIVPFGAWSSPEPPTALGQTFHRNEAFGLWALHVWIWRHNASGMFADWNPAVSCEAAP